MNKYLFILCPPYSGSTVLWKLVSTSAAVSSLPNEGQFLPEVKDVMRRDPWNADITLPWTDIKKVWDGYWDRTKPLLVEKSPPNLIRTRDILEHFKPICFLLMVRNPYAHCEGLMRRNGVDATTAAEFSVRCMKAQAANAAMLENVLSFTYEELVASPEDVGGRIERFLPEIGTLHHRQSFRLQAIDGWVDRRIVDLNQTKLDNLSPEDVRRITSVLRRHPDVMSHWRYDFYTPSRYHALTFAQTRATLLFRAQLSRAKRVGSRLAQGLRRRSP